LRNNPGGLLDEAIAIADDFLNAGVIVVVKGREAADAQFANTHSRNKVADLKPIVSMVARLQHPRSQPARSKTTVAQRLWGPGLSARGLCKRSSRSTARQSV